MQPNKHVVIIAGEESGDKHAATLVNQLKSRHPDYYFSGIGGNHMKKAGVMLVNDLASHGVTGITEVIRHLKIIHYAFRAIKNHLTAHKPDLLILVDYPGFNLRLAKFAKRVLHLQIIYYISPQIWAWKPKRIHLIKECVDHMAVILPFEKKLFENVGIPVSFVGHPLVSQIPEQYDKLALRHALGLEKKQLLLAIVPGSRMNEIKRHMPVLVATLHRLKHQFPKLHVVIPVASSIKPESIAAYLKEAPLPFTLILDKAVEVMACSDAVVVASGTASLECALLEKPMCIIYKASTLTYLIATKVIRVKYLGLCNLLEQKMIAPELLQYDFNPHELSLTIAALLSDKEKSARMRMHLKQLKENLSFHAADCSLVDLIVNKLNVTRSITERKSIKAH